MVAMVTVRVHFVQDEQALLLGPLPFAGFVGTLTQNDDSLLRVEDDVVILLVAQGYILNVTVLDDPPASHGGAWPVFSFPGPGKNDKKCH